MRITYATTIVFITVAALSWGCASRQAARLEIANPNSVSRIVHTLASDEMEGRSSFSPGIERAADFISAEFKRIGLQTYTANGYRQTFHVTRIQPGGFEVVVDGDTMDEERVIVSSSNPGIAWNDDPGVELLEIKAGEDFASRFREISTGGKDALVRVDTSFASLFARFKRFTMNPRVLNQTPTSAASIVYVLSAENPQSFRVNFTNTIEELPLSNLIGVLPGKSKKDEFVIFSAHYDHIGILPPVDQDSIANGADDNASGVSAVISLADYYKRRGDNERTLLFVAFTAEEIGMVGSRYFSSQIEPESVVTMINLEMIGKDSRFGPNSLYVTGFDHSDLAKIMQRNVEGTEFAFHPDPYPTQNLFYRSDNASLAAVGVPAHTFSTVQIERDRNYHTVKDEVETLDIQNIVSSIEGIAIGASSIVMGEDTPTRVPKLER